MKKESRLDENTILAQEKLAKAAQKFAAAFDQDRRWPDKFARLSYTLLAWRELALAAVEFSNNISAEVPSSK